MTNFTTPGIQTYTIGTSGTYDITADGAQGGGTTEFEGNPGGAGASVSGDVYLQAGTKLEIVVGGEGEANQGALGGGGGGGGSFVIEMKGPYDTILAVAGGGGGAGVTAGAGGRTGPTGGNGGGSNGGGGGGGAVAGAGQGGSFVPAGHGEDGGGGGGFTGGQGGGELSASGAGAVAERTFSGGAAGASGGAGGVGGGGGGGHLGGGGGGGFGGGGGGGGQGGGGGGSYLDAALTNDVATAAVNDGNGSVTITEVVCYLSDTRLLTNRGEVAVEKLEVGDVLVTASGAHRPVRWLGSRRVDCARHPEPAAVWPVRIQAGAFAPDVPKRALWVSPGHSILVEGVLIQAEKLVNGATILQVPLASVEYWHVELDSHDCIMAEGLAAESYLDTGNRAGFFNNGGAYLEAHPDFKPKHWAETCVPLVFEGAAVQKARSDLRERALALGYALTADPDVHALVDGRRVNPVCLSAERVAFLLPEGGSHIELRSRTFIPAHITPENTDTRSLGICVFRLQIDGEVAALVDDDQFRSGWNGLERYEHGRQQRWSRDRMPLPAGTRLVVIDMHRQNPVYWREPAAIATVESNRAARAVARF